MTVSKPLNDDNIRMALGHSVMTRGKQYFQQGRVKELTVTNDAEHQTNLSAKVQGTERKPYEQLLTLRWSINYQTITVTGMCSCPMSFNCKHVAAVCFAYQQRLLANQPSIVDRSCLKWLDSLDERNNVSANANGEFIAYVLKSIHARSLHQTGIDILVTRPKKTGGLTKGRSQSVTSLHYELRSESKKIAFLAPEDEFIVPLLFSQTTYSYQPQIKGTIGALLVEKMLDTGRLYWQTLDHVPLVKGEVRMLDFIWQTDADGNHRLKLDLTDSIHLILCEPLFYIDTQLGTLGHIDAEQFSSQRLEKLLAAPIVPSAVAEEFSQHLVTRHSNLPLPPPCTVELEDCTDVCPVPHLTLLGKDLPDGSHLPLMKVHFNYAEYSVSAHELTTSTTLRVNSGYVRILRDTVEENRYLEQVGSWGFERFKDEQKRDCLFFSPGIDWFEQVMPWQDFLQHQIPLLEAEGWRIDIDASFRLQFRHAHDWTAEIESTHNDWFEMHFDIDIDGRRLPLLPLLMPVLENYEPDELPEWLTVRLGPAEYLNLPSEKLKPFLAILYEMFGSLQLNEHGGLDLSRFDAASLAELEMHSYGLFSLQGGEALRELGRKIKAFSGIANVEVPDNLQAQLRNYQYQGLSWLQFLREYQFGGILADDMGLGKTLQTLAHLLLEKQSGRMQAPCLIVAPTSLMSNWRREAARFTPDLRVLVLQGYERKQHFDAINDYDLVLTTYPLLPRDEEFLLAQNYYYLILDEAQIVKNPHAKAAKIVREIRAEYRLCLTGTPMENHLGELWAQFDFLMPGFLGDAVGFKRIYRTPIEVHGNNEQRRRLSKRIAPFMLRRTKQEVVAELPPKTEIVRSVPLGSKQAMLYESIRLAMEQKVRQAIAEKGLARSHITILDALLKLRQTCCDPRTLPLNEAKKVKESAKLELLMDMLPEMLEEGRRILLFSQFTRMIGLIEDELKMLNIAYSKLTGQTRQRDEAIERFKSGEVNVFLISLKAGGVGLNLTEADTVIVYDPWWNPAAEAQAADRAHRIGQDKPVFVYKLITENTVEEKILAMQERKRALAEGVYDTGKQGDDFNLTADDLSMLFEPL